MNRKTAFLQLDIYTSIPHIVVIKGHYMYLDYYETVPTSLEYRHNSISDHYYYAHNDHIGQILFLHIIVKELSLIINLFYAFCILYLSQ